MIGEKGKILSRDKMAREAIDCKGKQGSSVFLQIIIYQCRVKTIPCDDVGFGSDELSQKRPPRS